MIETTVKEVDGVRFLDDLRVLEPDERRNGVGVHLIRWDMSGEALAALRLLGLRKVGDDPRWRADLYVEYPLPYCWYKVVSTGLRAYWWAVRFLYDNARFFQRIPENEVFSWRYFTPYVWWRKIRKRLT
jgi:hypothetical protein